MRAASYCIAESFDLAKLVSKLVDLGQEPKYFDDVIHSQKTFHNRAPIDIFYFPFGVVVIWGAQESEENIITDELIDFADKITHDSTYDALYYSYDLKESLTYINEEKNELILNDETTFSKLAVSHALAQSVKLEVLELSVSNLLEMVHPLQKELAETGSVSMSKTELSKKIGMLFSERYAINLHSDILDTPEFFWRRPSYEPIYLMVTKFQDIALRQNVLNHRLNMIQELYGILSDEMNHKHSSRLEWIIIILITSEVIMGLMNQDFFGWILSLVGINI